MKIAKIETTIKTRYQTIDRLFKKIVRTQDGEDIRKFRIEVKKLRAFLYLLTPENAQGNTIRLPNKIDSFYDEIGELRSFQLQYKLVHAALNEKYSILPVKYLSFLTNRITAACRTTSRLKKEKPQFRKAIARTLKKIDTGNRAAVEFTRVKIKVMNELTHPFFQGDETLHAIRKVLKDIIHNWPYLKRISALNKGFSIFTDLEDMKIMAKLLGNFQNKCSALALLNEFDPKIEGNKPGRIFLRDLEKKWKGEKESLRETVNRIIQNKIASNGHSALLLPAHNPMVMPLLLSKNAEPK